MPITIDMIDRKILAALQENGRIQNTELAAKVGLSPSPCLRRVRILETEGVVAGYTALIDARAVGLPLIIFVRVALERQDKTGVDRFSKAIVAAPAVLECYLMAGTYDFLLKVSVRDLEEYQRFQMQHLTREVGVSNVITEIPLKKVKSTTALPL